MLVRRILLLLAGLIFLSSTAAFSATQLEGSAALDFSARNAENEAVQLSSYKGNVVLLNFWATWCDSCRDEMPPLDALYQRYRATGLVILGVNLDDKFSAGIKMAKQLGITYPIVFDVDKKISQIYQVGAMPMTVLIDSQGIVKHVHYGFNKNTIEKYDTEVRRLLVE